MRLVVCTTAAMLLSALVISPAIAENPPVDPLKPIAAVSDDSSQVIAIESGLADVLTALRVVVQAKVSPTWDSERLHIMKSKR